MRTGEVLDYIVKSLACHTCQIYKNKHKTEEYIQWSEKHSSVCNVNHKGSSDSMESQGACEILLRSVEKHNLKYTQFVGDGDTGSFAKVRDSCEEAFKGNYVVVKEELKGRLPDKIIGKVQNCYGEVILVILKEWNHLFGQYLSI